MAIDQHHRAASQTLDDSQPNGVLSTFWMMRALLVVFAPPLVACALYLPFYSVAAEVNIAYRNDTFYYRGAGATWPLYAACVAIVLALLANRFRLRWVATILLCTHGFVALWFYTGYFGDRLDFSGFARTGLDSWPANREHGGLTGPILSVIAVPVVYVIFSLCTFALVHRLRCSRTSHALSSKRQLDD